MDRRKALAAKGRELGPLLHRKFWQPLRNTMEIFHVLPVLAAAALFLFLATDGQFREIYISYLEGWGDRPLQWLMGIVAGALILALNSAVLSEAHYALSTMRINVIYSSNSNPDANSRLKALQRSTAFTLAFVPWLGLAVGLFSARNFVADRYCKLYNEIPAGTLFTVNDLHNIQYLLMPSGWAIATSVIFLGFAIAAFSCVEQRTRNAQRAVAFIAPPLGALLFLLFTDWLTPSLRQNWAIIFCVTTAILTAAYFLVYQRLYGRRPGPIFSRPLAGTAAHHASLEIEPEKSRRQLLVSWLLSFFVTQPDFSTGISLRQRRRQMLFSWAFAPWLLLALYFVIVPHLVGASQDSDDWYQVEGTSHAPPHSLCPIAAAHVPIAGHWTVFPVAICCTIALGLLFGLLLNRLSEWQWRRSTIIIVVGILAAAAVMTSMFVSVDTLVNVYRTIGPLGTVTLQLLFLIATFALLAWLSQRSGFPVLTLALLAIVVCVLFPTHAGLAAAALGIVCVAFASTAFLSRLYAVGAFALILPVLGAIQYHQLDVKPIGQVPKQDAIATKLSVKFQYECWLRQRGVLVDDPDAATELNETCPLPRNTQSPKAPYPVFLIAAEGGGIYAASAAAMFLGKLQQQSPRFGEHIFAISGVSGGAIGSTIFQALDKVGTAQPAAASSTQQNLTNEVTKIMEDDHFSPVVGSIFPEILGASMGRADALIASFQLSTAARNAAAGQALAGPFAQHWGYDPSSKNWTEPLAPALVLNATWVETGFRVAFAPFLLHDIDESLYSFSDEGMPDERCPTTSPQDKCFSLIDAAAVSARFPLVLPPFSVKMQNESGSKRWNFVDGGYTDNSGATTALDLYEVLKNVAPDQVNLQIILVTSSTLQPNLAGTDINGTVFRDTLAPIDALMNVRQDLGNDAVARACSEVSRDSLTSQVKSKVQKSAKNDGDRDTESNQGCVGQAGQSETRLHVVEIQDQTYGLALGWKISQTTFSVVSWMLGDATKCPSPPSSPSSPGPEEFSQESVGDSPNELVEKQAGNDKLTRDIVDRNSCVMKLVEDLVAGEATPDAHAASPQGGQ
jgi:hypothetical protein